MLKRLLVVLVLAGCMPSMVLLRGRGGDLVRCEAGGGAAAGYIVASVMIDDCVEQYEKLGYVRANQASVAPSPPVPVQRTRRFSPTRAPEEYPRRVERGGLACLQTLETDGMVLENCDPP